MTGWARARLPLNERRRRITGLITALSLNDGERLAAEPKDGFDLPLPPRRRFLHTFTGVDGHLEEGLPYPVGHPRSVENSAIAQENRERVENLLRIAAAIRIGAIRSDAVEVSTLNLATGHHLPAGFAFAREVWVELSARSRPSEAWTVLIGGKDGRPLAGSEPLDKSEPGLHNFQGVLFDRQRNRETVLQNEATDVLFGAAARAKGFKDRQQFLLPGEERLLKISIPVAWRDGQHLGEVRVRLLLRPYPHEFFEGLAERFEACGDHARATRTRHLLAGLPIHVMAEDVLSRRE